MKLLSHHNCRDSAIFATSGMARQLSGAGASFPAPLYQRWAVEYNKLHPKVQLNYQSVGSSAGVKQGHSGDRRITR